MYAEVLIKISIRRSAIKYYMLKQSDYTLKIGDKNLRSITINSNSDQRHINQVINILKRHQQLSKADSEALLYIQDRINANGFLQTRSSPKGKCVIIIKLTLWATSLYCLYKQVSLQKEARTYTQQFAKNTNHAYSSSSKFILYSKLNLCNLSQL